MIVAGTLQVGNGGTTGTLGTGAITNNGMLTLDSRRGPDREQRHHRHRSAPADWPRHDRADRHEYLQWRHHDQRRNAAAGNGGVTGSLVGNVIDNGVLAFNRSDTFTFASVISGTGGLLQLGPGTTILTGANTYTGGTTIIGGTLLVGGGGTLGTGGLADNGMLTFNGPGVLTFGGNISGAGGLQQNGSGSLVLTGTNTLHRWHDD